VRAQICLGFQYKEGSFDESFGCKTLSPGKSVKATTRFDGISYPPGILYVYVTGFAASVVVDEMAYTVTPVED
jgi:hypothetical protein